MRIMDNKMPDKSKARPFPTADVIELRRLADEYKVIRGRCFIVSCSKSSHYLASQLSTAIFVHPYVNPTSDRFVFSAIQLLD